MSGRPTGRNQGPSEAGTGEPWCRPFPRGHLLRRHGRRREGDVSRAYLPASGASTDHQPAMLGLLASMGATRSIPSSDTGAIRRWRHTRHTPRIRIVVTVLIAVRRPARLRPASVHPAGRRPPQRSPWPFGAGRLAAVCQGAAGGARWGAGPHVAPVHAAWAAALHFPSGHGHRSSPRPRIALAGWLQRLRSQGQAWGIEPQTRSYLTNALEKADREEHAPVRE